MLIPAGDVLMFVKCCAMDANVTTLFHAYQEFCTHDYYNRDWTLQSLGFSCLRQTRKVMVMKSKYGLGGEGGGELSAGVQCSMCVYFFVYTFCMLWMYSHATVQYVWGGVMCSEIHVHLQNNACMCI